MAPHISVRPLSWHSSLSVYLPVISWPARITHSLLSIWTVLASILYIPPGTDDLWGDNLYMKTDTEVAIVSLGGRAQMKCTIEPTEERPQRWILLLDGSLCEWQDQEKRAYPLLNPYDPFLIASQITSNKVSFSNAVHFWKGILRRSLPNFVVFELLRDKISANYGCGRQCIMLSPKDGIVLILLPS